MYVCELDEKMRGVVGKECETGEDVRTLQWALLMSGRDW